MNLADLEGVIESGLASFRDVGKALARIRQGRLYREIDRTWAEYCRRRWGFTDRHADRLIQACKVVRQLGPIGRESSPVYQLPPANEAQTRELARVPATLRRRVLDHVQATGRPTALQIRQVRESIEGLSPEEKLAAAQGAEVKALTRLQDLEREAIVEKIERMCVRLRQLHAKLPAAEKLDAMLGEYLALAKG